MFPGEVGQRNNLRGHGVFSIDMAIGKRFQMPFEGHSLQFRAEAFNLTNSVRFNTAVLDTLDPVNRVRIVRQLQPADGPAAGRAIRHALRVLAVGRTENYVAVDLGAGSGRVVLGSFDGERISLKELHRFANPAIEVLGHLHWDALRLFSEMKEGLRKAAAFKPVSLGVDTWGVDFALLDRNGALIGNPFHYRDSRTNGMQARAFEVVSREEIFEHTGLQFMECNSLYQLLAMKGSAALDAAQTLLMMPDLFHYWFTGVRACEYSDATTTQFFDPRKRTWATPLLEKLGLPTKICAEIVEPGTLIGALRGASGGGSAAPVRWQSSRRLPTTRARRSPPCRRNRAIGPTSVPGRGRCSGSRPPSLT